MNALSIDCAVSRLAVACKKDNQMVKYVIDAGLKQSEKLLPAIDFVLKENGLKVSDLDYTAVTLGPGTFTGLRLGLSALKALNLSHNIPVYGIPSLKAYAYPYNKSTETVLSVIQAKEDEFFNGFFVRGTQIKEDGDNTTMEILNEIAPETNVLVCGPGAAKFKEKTLEITPLYNIHCWANENDACESLFSIAEEMITNNQDPLKDYDGPVYVRKSEAEIVLEQKKENAK